MPKKSGEGGGVLALVELGGGEGAVQVSGNLGLAVIPRFDTKPDPLIRTTGLRLRIQILFFAYYTLPWVDIKGFPNFCLLMEGSGSFK
jgi:hypothetical protein